MEYLHFSHPPPWPTPRPEQAARRQYSLADLMAYILAASVYLAMIASVTPLFFADDPERSWTMWITIPVAWGVLWLLYRRWRLRQALKIHYAGPVIALGLIVVSTVIGLVAWVTSPWFDGRVTIEFASVMGLLLLTGCGVSVAVGLPAATLMLVYLALRPK